MKWEEQDLKFEAEIPEPRRPAGTLSTERHARSDNEDGRLWVGFGSGKCLTFTRTQASSPRRP